MLPISFKAGSSYFEVNDGFDHRIAQQNVAILVMLMKTVTEETGNTIDLENAQRTVVAEIVPVSRPI